MPGYLLDEDSIARLAKMLRDYEQGTLFAPGQTDRDDAGESPVVHYVRCTSATAVSGLYPGMLLSYDASTGTYSDVSTIKLLEINGSTPTASTRYLARFAGYSSSGDTVYAISSSGGGGAILSIDVVTSISCVDGVITPVWTTLCIPGAYVCTTTTTTTTSTTTTSTTTTTTTTTTSTTTTAEPTTTTTTTAGE